MEKPVQHEQADAIQILIVEDDRILTHELNKKLCDLNYQVKSVTSGEAALGAVEHSPPDLILMDIMLDGELDGIATAEKIQERFETPVIYLTGVTDKETVDRAQQTNPYGFIVKPYKRTTLNSAIEIALVRSRLEKKLKSEDQWLRSLMESLHSGILVEDARRRISYVNTAFCQMFGLPSPEAAVGASVPEACSMAKPLFCDPEFFESSSNEAFENLVTIHEEELELVDGRILARDFVPIMEDEILIGCMWHYRDITVHKKTAAELRRRAERTVSVRDTVEQLNSCNTIQEVYDAALAGIMQCLGGTRASILLFSSNDKVDFKAWRNISQNYRDIVNGHCPWERDEIDAAAFFIDDIANSDIESELGKHIADEGIMACGFFPIKGRSELFGKFMVYYDQPIAHTENDLATGRVIADNLSASIRRVKTRDALVFSESKFRSIFENISEGIYQSTPEGKFITVNPALVKMLGYESEQEVLALDLRKDFYMNPADRDRLAELVDQEGVLRGVELVCKRKDGSPIIVLMNDRAVNDENGKLLYYEGTLEDITDERQLQSALQRIAVSVSSQVGTAFFETLVENLAQVLNAEAAFIGEIHREERNQIATVSAFGKNWQSETGIYDIDGTPLEATLSKGSLILDGNAQEAYPDFVPFQRIGAETFIGVRLSDAHESDMGVICVFGGTLTAGTSLSTSMMQIFAARASAELERLNSEQERKKLEEQMWHASKLESLGVLAGGIAHDFNNLLVGILGNSDLALMELPQSSPVRETIERIRVASQRAAELTRQMLAYSGKGQFVLETLHISELVKEIIHLIEVTISKKTIVKYEFEASLPPVEADATQLRQVILNLITNASEAIGDKSGRIHISTGLTHATREYLDSIFIDDQLPEGDYVLFEVRDTGAGMDEETLGKIFDPFFSTKFTGRGLGLASVLGIIRGHRGTIEVNSEPGRGTTFRVLLPCSEKLVAETNGVDAFPPRLNAEGTVLIVDDEETVRTVTRRVLENYGFNTILAATGKEGVEKYKANSNVIDLVLLDMMMPEMSGDEAYAAISAIDKNSQVVLMSGYTEQEALERFDGSGLSGFLQKPFKLEELVSCIGSILDIKPSE